MKLRKGQKIVFNSGRVETIEKASNDHINGEVKTDKNTYSTDFIQRWISFGFCKIETVSKTKK
jgi:preprotein translocase subunit YajC